MSRALNLIVLGRGKTGSLVSEVASGRGHLVRVISSVENANANWLTPDNLQGCDALVDFTSPHAVLANIEACVEAGKNMVVGTTGWYADLKKVRQCVESRNTGFVFGANFSYGVNLFFQITQAAARSSGTRLLGAHHRAPPYSQERRAIRYGPPPCKMFLKQASGVEVDITSEREGDVTGTHSLELTSSGDRILLTHEALSRQTFAEGAVLAAEWIAGKRGFYDFKDIFGHL